jgi:aminoglycoside phosphotransferase (APT) family kinase protein
MEQGWETELKKIEMKYYIGNEIHQESIVIRIYPDKHGREKAGKEYHLMRSLDHIGYPVPKVFHLESTGKIIGRPFITMEYINGTLLSDILTTQSDYRKISAMMELLVRLHETDPRFIYPDSSLPTSKEAIERYLKFHRKFIEETKNSILTPAVKWIAQRLEKVVEMRSCLIHGDYHANNILISDSGKLTVIDWGASTLGDPREDICWTMLLHSIYGNQESGAALLEAYREASPRSIDNIDFFMVAALIRRFVDLLASLHSGSETKGMRENTVELMKDDKQNYLKAYNILREITDLELDELHRFIINM